MSFNNMVWSPLEYANAAVLARETGEEMLARLDWVTLQPKVIVDLGCGTGEMSSKLQTRYPEANVVALDLSSGMIEFAKQKNHGNCINADAGQLPLRSQSVDLLFANLIFPWYEDINLLLKECRRVLRPDGLILFTAFGPDTLKEWRTILTHHVTPFFIDMHDVGDLMLQAGFADPVLDVNHYTLTYREQNDLFQELQASGMLSGQPEIINADEITLTEEGTMSVTYEIVFAHAFAPAQSDEVQASSDGVTRVPLAHLRRRLRS
jgi:malonyl-CoA O-methyltransferase